MAFWDRGKTNRLKKPKQFKLAYTTPDSITMGKKVTFYGCPWPAVGDYVFVGNSPSAGTVGRVMAYDYSYICNGGPSIEMEMLSGELKSTWVTYALVIDQAAVQEVKDFYIADGRPERIQVPW